MEPCNWLEEHINLTKKFMENAEYLKNPHRCSDMYTWVNDLNILNITKKQFVSNTEILAKYYVYLPNLSKEGEKLIRERQKDMPIEYNQVVVSTFDSSIFKYTYKLKSSALDSQQLLLNDSSVEEESFMI
jgi:hypothetical protein